METVIKPTADWLNENWLIVALIISEVAALMPTKIKGIVQGILKVGGAIFKKRVS